MSIYRTGVASTACHDASLEDLREAISYLGGVLVEDANELRPSEVVVQWSPRAAQRMRPQRQRETYSGWQAIPQSVVDQIIDGYRDGRANYQARLAEAGMACRPCKIQGRLVEATHELLGVLSVCEDCHNENAGLIARVEAMPQPIPLPGVFCRRCSEQVYKTPNLAEQVKVMGAFAGLCPPCWRSRKADAYLNGEGRSSL